jgi:hypothetical protein
MMKNKSTLAKLLSEEDINVVHKQMETAYFNSKTRELGLPIWKEEEMTKDIYDLMVCHEIGHALWTPLDMLEKASVRKLNHGVVNIIEDARIEGFVKTKYPGAIGVMKRGYNELVAKDFFGTKNEDINTFNLIDRINVFFKSGDASIKFTEEEKVWVDRVAAVKTEDEVLDLAEELYKYMEENAPETDNHDNGEAGDGEVGDENEGETSDGNGTGGDDADDSSAGDTGDDAGADAGTGTGEGKEVDDKTGDNGVGSGNDTGDVPESDVDDSDSGVGKPEGGKGVEGNSSSPKTDKAGASAMDAMRDKAASDRIYGNIPKVDLDKIVVGYKTVLKEMSAHYRNEVAIDNQDGLYFNKTLEESEALKKDSKKTVAYMVKEFEMKKAADQYARASVSKTGSLNMSKLHTYKYNEDLFKKVTTLPGATNHGLVMMVDWSGSMHDNLKGTMAQIFNLVWFCRKVNIPFSVVAFSDVYGREGYGRTRLPFSKAGDIVLRGFNLLEFFNSDMTASEENAMIHNMVMYYSYGGAYRDWREEGYPYSWPAKYRMGGTPLNEAIIGLMDYVPMFKEKTGVQKINTVILTDGAGSSLEGIHDYKLITEGENKGDHTETITGFYGWGRNKTKTIVKDKISGKIVEGAETPQMLELLKARVPGMNVVGFFIAGSGKSGRVDKRSLYYLLPGEGTVEIMEKVKFLNKNKYLAITSLGYDEYYVLPGGNAMEITDDGLSDELIGASKAKLKTAFGKSMKGKISSRPLLNKFIKLVA